MRQLLLLATFLLASPFLAVAASAEKSSPPPYPGDPAVRLPAYNVKGALVRGFTIGYGVKYLLWGPVDDVSFEDVDAGSLPARAGIKSGDRLLAIDDKPVKTMKRRDFERALFRNAATVRVDVETPGAAPRNAILAWPADFWDPKLGAP